MYAPVNSASSDEIVAFFDGIFLLIQELDNLKTILIGDFNAHIKGFYVNNQIIVDQLSLILRTNLNYKFWMINNNILFKDLLIRNLKKQL